MTFDKLAATCPEWLTKDREVAVVGKLRLNEWTTKDGERRSRIQVVADAVQFLGAPTKTADPDGGGRQAGRRRLPAQGQLTRSRLEGGHPSPDGRPRNHL